MSYEVITKERWTAESYIFCRTTNSFNTKGEVSTRYLIDDDGKFCFHTEDEAKGAIEKYLSKGNNIGQEISRIFEIRKVYITE
jgi:hypothetical protein